MSTMVCCLRPVSTIGREDGHEAISSIACGQQPVVSTIGRRAQRLLVLPTATTALSTIGGQQHGYYLWSGGAYGYYGTQQP